MLRPKQVYSCTFSCTINGLMRPEISLLAQPHGSTAERIERSIEDQAFSRSFKSAPRPPPSLLSFRQIVSLSQSSIVSLVQLTGGRGGGGGVEPNHATARKLGPLWIIQSSMVYRSTASQKAWRQSQIDWDLPKANSGIFCDPKKYSIRTLCKLFYVSQAWAYDLYTDLYITVQYCFYQALPYGRKKRIEK